ncbi:MAG: hypothetical protein AABY22_27170 [Nanoarchaeota archaeon]
MELPNKDKKVDQKNFTSYRESRDWLQRNGFKSVGMVLDEPWKEYFVERWEKEGFVALTVNILYLPKGESLSLPLLSYEKPYQIDIALSSK